MSQPLDYNIDEAQIQYWKYKYGSIYKTPPIDGVSFIFRAITLDEWRYLSAENSSEAAQDWAISQLILYPEVAIEDLDQKNLLSLYSYITSAATFDNQQQLNLKVMDLRQSLYDDLWIGIIVFILQTIPKYTISELKAMTDDELLETYIIAEMIRSGISIELCPDVKPSQMKKLNVDGASSDMYSRVQKENVELGQTEQSSAIAHLQEMSMKASQEQLTRTIEQQRKASQVGKPVSPTDWTEENINRGRWLESLNKK